jgi:hypothetical protein
MITNVLYLQCFIAGILGILFHVFAIKLPATQSRAKAANIPFSLKDYLSEDWIALGASVLTVLIAVFALDEVIGYKPAILKYVKYFFVFIGFTGSSILIAVLGKAGKAINNIVDIKTDIADATTTDKNSRRYGP